MRRLTAFAAGATVLVGAACASVATPPGGPEDEGPPRIVGSAPDTGATGVRRREIEIRFDEVIAERATATGGLDQQFLLSPSTGATRVRWHRDRITIEPRGGLRPNTTYRLTVLPGLRDLRDNPTTEPWSLVFSTGDSIHAYGIVGRIWDWATQQPAVGALVQARLPIGERDTLTYQAYADSGGQFELGPMPAGRYLLRGIIDQNRNRALDRLEKWHERPVELTTFRPVVELLAIERDTMPPRLERIDVVDSVSLRLTFDRALDPAMTLAPASARVVRADSTALFVSQVVTAAADSARREQERALADTARPVVAQPPPPARADAPPTPPPARPSLPPPPRALIIRLGPQTPIVPGTSYRVTLRDVRNLLGRSATVERVFTAPRADTTRRPPPPAAPPPPR